MENVGRQRHGGPFPSVNYLTLPDRFLNDAERGRIGLSIWEMSVYQEAILVAEGT